MLRAIVDGIDETQAMERALAEHVAAHPEDAGRTVDDFDWIVLIIVDPPMIRHVDSQHAH